VRGPGIVAAARTSRDGRPARLLLLGRLLLSLLLAMPHLRASACRCSGRQHGWRRWLLMLLHRLLLVPALLLFRARLLLRPRRGPCCRECWARVLPSGRCRPPRAVVHVRLLLVLTLLVLQHLPVMLLLRGSRVPDRRPRLQSGGLAAAVLLDRRRWGRPSRRCLGQLALGMAHAHADGRSLAELHNGQHAGRERTAVVVIVGHRTVGDTGCPGALQHHHRFLMSLRRRLLLRLRIVPADRRCCLRRGRRGAGLLVVAALLAVLRQVGGGAVRLSRPRRG